MKRRSFIGLLNSFALLLTVVATEIYYSEKQPIKIHQ